jgi:hypothetical protein
MLDFLLYIPVTLLCLIPFGFSCFYFVVSLRLLLIGRKEHSVLKMKSSQYTCVFSIVGAISSYALWRLLAYLLDLAFY